MRQAKPAAFLDHSDRNSDAVCSNDKILTGKVEKLNIECRQYFLLYPNLLTFLVGISSEEQLAAEFFHNSKDIWFLEEFQRKLQSDCRREF